MRFERVRVANFRGVTSREVRFGPGVTIVEGPNEAGKSTLKIAVNLLFKEKATAKKSEIRACKPVDRDEGPEVEVELRTGPYHLVYMKRYLKSPQTTLRVIEPSPENLTGDDAHARVERILAETVDVDLWRALQVDQWRALEKSSSDTLKQAELAGSRALGRALDAAAGGESPGDEDIALIERAHQHYERFFTPGGANRQNRTDAAQAVEGARVRAAELESDYRGVEALVAEHEQASGRLRGLAALLPKQRQEVATQEAAEGEITRLDGELETRRLEQDNARAALAAADNARTERETTRHSAQASLAALEAARTRREQSTPDLETAERTAGEARAARDAARESLEGAQARLEAARAALGAFSDRESHKRLFERLERIELLRQRVREAAVELERNKVTESVLEAIRDAWTRHRLAEQRLSSDAPRLELTALADVNLRIDGERVHLASAQTRTENVVKPVSVVLPGLVELKASPGTGAVDLERESKEALSALERALRAAGAESFEAAQDARDRRGQARRAEAQARADLERELAGESPDELGTELEKLRSRLGDAEAALQVCGFETAEEAEAARQRAAEAMREAKANAERAELEHERRARQAGEARESAARLKVEEEMRAGESRKAADALASARGRQSDEALSKASEEAAAALERTEKALGASRAAYDALDPERVRALAQNARDVALTTDNQLREAENGLSALSGRLETIQERGLHEALERARAVLDHATDKHERLERDARAAARLHSVLNEARDEARRGYVQPLTNRIESLARIVFGGAVSIRLEEDLTIGSRTLDGRTVAFSSLSGGAQEQLDLLSRVAAAMVVSEEGGVPLIFDDSLGSSDPGRLRSMGAALARAGEHCQIIVFTCFPDRFRQVGKADFVTLEAVPPPEPA